MLEGLRWRVLAATGMATALGLAVFVGLLAASGSPQLVQPLFYIVAVSVAVVGVLLASRLVLAPVSRSARSMVEWARAVAQDGPTASLDLDPDFGEVAASLREAARAVSDELTLLRTERARLSVAIEHMESGVILLDRSYRIMLINPAAARLLGTSVQAAEWRSLIETARDHELVAVARACLDGQRGGLGTQPPNRTQVTADNEGPANATADPTVIELGEPRRWVQVVGTSIPGLASPAPAGNLDQPSVLLLLQDVTQLRAVEVVRQEFVANVSHELRTPLAGLKAVAETLEAGALEDPPAARGFLDRILIEVDRLTELVAELLELARLESGAPQLALELVDLFELATRAAERLGPRAQQSGIALRVQNPGAPVTVSGDPLRLERVFVNLLENAIKYSPLGGDVQVSFERANGEVVAAVRDGGQGMPPADLPRIFERFYKGDRARSSPGSGLGLAIVKHTVQAHRGRVWAESTEGKGSTFFVRLPLAVLSS